ncbi:MAG: hypothetical protein IT289_11185 [Oligoflexia bacterium]|nr:hypothetical protein [Oligoflexia bacterium]
MKSESSRRELLKSILLFFAAIPLVQFFRGDSGIAGEFLVEPRVSVKKRRKKLKKQAKKLKKRSKKIAKFFGFEIVKST